MYFSLSFFPFCLLSSHCGVDLRRLKENYVFPYLSTIIEQNCSSKTSIVHRQSSSMFPCAFVRCPATFSFSKYFRPFTSMFFYSSTKNYIFLLQIFSSFSLFVFSFPPRRYISLFQIFPSLSLPFFLLHHKTYIFLLCF